MSDHDTFLGPALRDRIRSEQPDLERLATASLLAGRRLRRRRTTGMVAASAAAVAGIGLGASLLGGGAPPEAVDEAGPAAAPAAPSLSVGQVDAPPVTVGAGWACEWFLVDDKASCTADDGGVASLVIRDAADRAAWLGSTDKGDTSAVWTSENHDGIFISVQGGDGTTNAEVRRLGHSLAWVD